MRLVDRRDGHLDRRREVGRTEDDRLEARRRGADLLDVDEAPRGLDLGLDADVTRAPGRRCCSTWVSSRSSATTSEAAATLGSMTSSRRGPALADDLDHVAVGPRRCPSALTRTHSTRSSQSRSRIACDDLGSRRHLLVGRHRVLEVEEGHVGDRGRGLGEEAIRGTGRGQAGPARQVRGSGSTCGEPTLRRARRRRARRRRASGLLSPQPTREYAGFLPVVPEGRGAPRTVTLPP